MLLALVAALPPAPVAVPTPAAPRKISRVEAIHLGVSRNYDLLARRLEQRRTELASARFAYAWNQALPALNVNAALTLFRFPVPEAIVGVSLAVPLDRGAR